MSLKELYILIPFLYSGCTPLHLAARRAHTNVVRLLISYEADVNIEDNVRLIIYNIIT